MKKLLENIYKNKGERPTSHYPKGLGVFAQFNKKIGPVEQSLPVKAESICEIRLLSVKKEYRNGRIFLGIAQFLARYCLKKGYDVGVISGIVRQLKLYEQMGFQPFADLVGSGDAIYQPMLMTKETFDQSIAGRIIKPTVNFLPGPIQISDAVISSLMIEANSHRSKPFIGKMKQTKKCSVK